ncbi:hypothetical protein [Specibacter sp. NPDC078692]|uniref:hypothetical protein n=1 Tax=Specibacter sp. NPDC078692 TaxID=3155818 RepID=UPI0034241916
MDDGDIFTYRTQTSGLLAYSNTPRKPVAFISARAPATVCGAAPSYRSAGHTGGGFHLVSGAVTRCPEAAPRLYRVRRFDPGTMDKLLADPLEALQIDQRCRLLGSQMNGRAEDLYGHLYRVVARREQDPTRMYRPGGTGADTADLWYVEVKRRRTLSPVSRHQCHENTASAMAQRT